MRSTATPDTLEGSFDDFEQLLVKVQTMKGSRLLSLDAFLAMSNEDNTLILDTRSDFRFERKHLARAKHLAFTDFTQQNLATVIPSFDTRVLIYCNNNFTGDQIDFATKVAQPNTFRDGQFASQTKPLMLALNIPSFITLFGYGYTNVYALNEIVDVSDKRLSFEGVVVKTAFR